MAAPDTQAPLLALRTLCTGLPGIEETYVGVPKSTPSGVVALLTGAYWQVDPRAAGGSYYLFPSYRIEIGYLTNGDVEACELNLVLAIGGIAQALMDNQTLDHTVESIEVRGPDPLMPDYRDWSGLEFRFQRLDIKTKLVGGYHLPQ